MPFLTLYLERQTLSGLGYTSNLDDLDLETGNKLVLIHCEIKKQEKEEHEASTKKRKR